MLKYMKYSYIVSCNLTKICLFPAYISQRSCLERKIIKGRIFSKFHGKKMEELSANALQKTVTLYLTLALAGDIKDNVIF